MTSWGMTEIALLAVNASTGFALGMSVVVLVEVAPMPFWLRRHPWLLAAVLAGIWLPFALSGDPTTRQFANTAVNLHLIVMFLLYLRKSDWHPNWRHHHVARKP